MNNIINNLLDQEDVIDVLNNVFDNFDFERVKRTMDALDWTWDWVGEENAAQTRRVPTIDEIKEFAANLMWECANEDIDCISSGGFRVEKDFSDPDDLWMRLSFEVTESDFYTPDHDM